VGRDRRRSRQGGARRGQGRDNAREFLKNNPDIADQIEAQVRGNSTRIEEELLIGSPEPGDE